MENEYAIQVLGKELIILKELMEFQYLDYNASSDNTIKQLQIEKAIEILSSDTAKSPIPQACPECMSYNKKTDEEFIKCWNCGESYRNEGHKSNESKSPIPDVIKSVCEHNWTSAYSATETFNEYCLKCGEKR